VTSALDDKGRIVIVGTGLAGLRAAESLRSEGFTGEITMVGDEPWEPYDRPPLSKQALVGFMPPDHVRLPRLVPLEPVSWHRDTSAVRLDRDHRQVELDDGTLLDYDRVLISTGVRARPWPDMQQATLDGVFVVHSVEDSLALRERLANKPQRVLLIGAGFVGGEVASACRMLDLDVTVVEAGPTPLCGSLGATIGKMAAQAQRDFGVDLRCGVTVEALEGDADGRLRSVRLSNGTSLEVDVAVAALGAIRNTEWLGDSGLAAGPQGVTCDTSMRAVDSSAMVTDDVFVAGDVARFPHPLFGYELISLEHWKAAVLQAEVAAHNMVCHESERRPFVNVPSFWSIQFELNIKVVGLPNIADEVVVTQGSVADRRFVAAYGRRGRLVAAVTVNQGRYLEFYERQIAEAAAFPTDRALTDAPEDAQPEPALVLVPNKTTHQSPVTLAGEWPGSLHAESTWTPEVGK
jgi:NADPH-dependent 2,4-dienoyl-CoA reductase/sulfur reductase-like enzyme